MPKKVEERTTTIDNIADLLEFAQECDHASIMRAHAPNGDETRFQLVQNTRTGDYVSAMGGQYALVQHEEVVLGLTDAIARSGLDVKGGFIKQTPNRFRAVVEFDRTVTIGKDESPMRLGAVIRNSFDGSTSVEASLFIMRGFCNNGLIFGREDMLGGKLQHKGDVSAKLNSGLFEYFGNLDAVLAPWAERMEVAQNVVFADVEELQEVLAGAKLGKKLTEEAVLKLPQYVEELGSTPYAAYQAATDAITHFRNGKDEGLNGAATDRAHVKAEKLLLARPTTV